MTVTLKLILDTKRKKNIGTYPIKVRITIDRRYKDFPLSLEVEQQYWDKKLQKVKESYPNCDLVNNRLKTKKLEYERALLKLDLSNKTYDLNDVARVFRSDPEMTFIDYGLQQVEILKRTKKYGTAYVYEDAISKLKRYVKHGKPKIEQVNYMFLKKFEDAMLEDGLKINTISVYMRTIRAIYNRAIKEKLVDSNNYPFTEFKIKTEKTRNRNLSIENIRDIATLDLPVGSPIWDNRNYFILSFCLIGMSFIDLSSMKMSNIFNGRLLYRRAKTGRNYSIKLQPEAIEILSHYTKGKGKDDYVLPIFPKGLVYSEELKKISMLRNDTCNKYLELIAKELKIPVTITTYYARYSWANIAREVGFSKDLIAEALGHEYGNKVTGIYLDDYDLTIIDEANEAVLKKVFSDSNDTTVQ